MAIVDGPCFRSAPSGGDELRYSAWALAALAATSTNATARSAMAPARRIIVSAPPANQRGSSGDQSQRAHDESDDPEEPRGVDLGLQAALHVRELRVDPWDLPVQQPRDVGGGRDLVRKL